MQYRYNVSYVKMYIERSSKTSSGEILGTHANIATTIVVQQHASRICRLQQKAN